MIASFRSLVTLTLAYARQLPSDLKMQHRANEVGRKPMEPPPSRQEPAAKPPLTASVEKPSEPVLPPPPSPTRVEPQREIRTILKKIAPALPLLDPPDDQMARLVADSWKITLPKTQVLLLALSPSSDDLNFLKRLAKAIEGEKQTPKILAGERLEREKQWEALFSKNSFSLVLISPHLEKYPELLKNYTAIPAQKTALLHNVPCIPLQSASVYKQNKQAKALLWKEILQTLALHVR